MSVQDAAIGSGGTIAVVGDCGVGAPARPRRVERGDASQRRPPDRCWSRSPAIFSSIAIYGEETFLYTLHIAPLLVCLAALATNTRLRTVALGSAALLVVLLAFHNSRELAEALSFFASGMR